MKKKSIEEAIWYEVDGPTFIEDQNLIHFDSWVKNKAQNRVFQPQAIGWQCSLGHGL